MGATGTLEEGWAEGLTVLGVSLRPPGFRGCGLPAASPPPHPPAAHDSVSTGLRPLDLTCLGLLLQRPPRLHVKPSQVPAVEVMPAGASYNPTLEDHQVHAPGLGRCALARCFFCAHPEVGTLECPRRSRACPLGTDGPVVGTDVFPDSDNLE